jgi:hypothetical protein
MPTILLHVTFRLFRDQNKDLILESGFRNLAVPHHTDYYLSQM